MIRVTADSNVYISALHFAGLPRQFLNAARSGAFILSISEPILEEVRQVLRVKFRWQEDILQDAMAQLTRFTVFVHPTDRISAVQADPDDNRILECAVTSGSGYLVTGDKYPQDRGISAAYTNATYLNPLIRCTAAN